MVFLLKHYSYKVDFPFLKLLKIVNILLFIKENNSKIVYRGEIRGN